MPDFVPQFNDDSGDFPPEVAPRCPLFGLCGGCQCQHLSYAHQLELKQQQLRGIYAAAGIDVDPLPAVASPLEYGYRTKLTPHYSPLRRDPSFPIGFLQAGRCRIIDVTSCPIATDAINAILPKIREETFAKKETFKKDGTLHLREDSSHNVLTDPRAICMQEINGIHYEFIVGEFFQVNLSILPILVERVMRLLGETKFVIDAYCGVGFFALQAAKHCQAVAGVEVSAVSVKLAQKNATINDITNATFLAAKAEAIFKEIKFPPEQTTVIIDPPRAGASEDFLRQLIALKPARVIYVACDPSTQARDVRILIENGFKLKTLQAFDLFPQTKHIESLAILERR